MAQLIITEKPDASKRLALALSDKAPNEKKIRGVSYYEVTRKGKPILIASTVGHLFNLREIKKEKQEYPVFDLEWAPSHEISKNAGFTKKYLDALKFLVKKADSFVVATDHDTEGALIGWTCIKFVCKKNDALRMKFSTLVKEELLESYEKMSKHLDKPLIEAGETRHHLDWLWGINITKFLTSAIKQAGMFKILSSGRVQSPILKFLTKKEKEILAFKPEPYWKLFAKLDVEGKELIASHYEGKIFEKKKAELLNKKCKNGKAEVKSVERTEHSLVPRPAFNITSLQTEAYKNFGYSPKRTLDIAQSLYLKAHLSYPRTSSEKLNPKINYKKIITSLSGLAEFKEISLKILGKSSLKPIQGKRKDPAHIAIYPTKEIPVFKSLKKDERNIYSLVARRFLATFSDPAIREAMKVAFEINKEKFIINGRRTIKPGWISAYGPFAKFKEISLPEMKKGQEFKVKKITLEEDETKPPKRYSQGSVISEMEKINLGTRATRAHILQILYDRNYIEDRNIKVTELGIKVSDVLSKYSPELVSEKLTREFEEEMEEIIERKKTKKQILSHAKKVLIKIIANMERHEEKIGKELLEALKETRDKENNLGKCPKCGEDLKILYSKKTKKKFVACSGYPKCKNTYSLTSGMIKPTKKVCKYCNTPIIKVVRKGKRPFEMCLTYDCKSKESWNKNHNSNQKQNPLQKS